MSSAILDPVAAHRRAAAVEARVLRERLTLPPDLTVSEWADRYRVLSPEYAAEPGRWRTDRAPYLREIMDSFSDPEVEQLAWMASSQVGKTEALKNAIGYRADQDPGPMLVVQPTLDMAQAFSKDRIAKMFRDSPRLAGIISGPKSRASENTILHKSFPGGHLTMTGANSPAALASRPIRDALFDEVDRYPASAGSEGDPVTLGIRRTATFWNRTIALVSTPTVRGFSRIEEAYEEGDQRRYFVPCPECGHHQTLVFANLRWKDNRPETAVYVCAECEAEIPETKKRVMLEAGEWRAQEPGRRIRSYHINALYSPWLKWSEVVTEWLEAKGNPERLRTFVNTILGETWEEDGDRLEADALEHRREEYSAEVPAGVGILVGAVDVQDDRLEVKVKGYGRGEESWLIEWEHIDGDPGQELVWEGLAEVLSRKYEHASGATLRLSSVAIDSGGHHTQEVYSFVRQYGERLNVFAVKGVGGDGRPLVGRPSKANRWGVKLVPVGTDTAKDTIFSRLKIPPPAGGGEEFEPTPGYMHFPDWLDSEYFRQLTAEKKVTRYRAGRPVRKYEKLRPRNEALDLEVYSLVALYRLGPAVVNRLGKWVDAANDAEATEKRKKSRRGSSRGRRRWVDGWRG